MGTESGFPEFHSPHLSRVCLQKSNGSTVNIRMKTHPAGFYCNMLPGLRWLKFLVRIWNVQFNEYHGKTARQDDMKFRVTIIELYKNTWYVQ